MKFIKLKDKDGNECYYRKCLILAVGEVEGRVRVALVANSLTFETHKDTRLEDVLAELEKE